MEDDEIEDTGARGFGTPTEDEPEPNVTPEEQAAYKAFVENAMKIIYGDKGQIDHKRLQSIIKALGASDDPIQDLAMTTATIVKRVEDSAEQQKHPLPEGVTFHAGAEILEDLAELAGKAKIHDFTDEELEVAGYRAIDQYRIAKGDAVDQDKAGAELAEMMNRDPKMAEIVTAMAEKAGKSIPSAGKGEAPSRNPDTGAQEFYDAEGGTVDTEGQGNAEADAAAIDAMGGKAEGGIDVGGLLERALDYINSNPVAVLSAGMPASGLISTGINAIDKANQAQATSAMEKGNFNENGSLYGGGFAGEKVGISLENAGPIDPDTGRGGPRNDAGSAEIYTPPPSPSLSDNYRTPARPPTAAPPPAQAPAAPPRQFRARGFGQPPAMRA